MTPKQLSKTLGNQAEIARAIGCTRSAVNRWFANNEIPQGRQYEIAARWPELGVSKKVHNGA